MLRGLLVSLLFIGLAIYSLSNSTMAVFTDTETSSGTFAVGAMDFRYRVSQDSGVTWGVWQNGTSASFSLPGLQRGQNGRVVYQLQNTGSVDSLLDLRNVVLVDYESGCSIAEATVDTTCGNPGIGQGELGSTLLVTVMIGSTLVFNGPLSGFPGDYDVNKLLPGEGTVEMTIDWFLPSLPVTPAPVDPPPPSHAVKSGSYLGSGTDDRAITGLGFQPDVVIIKGDTSQVAVMRTSTMSGDATKPMVGSTGLTANMIQSLNADGFTLGTHATVNSNGVTYYWVAFKAAEGDLKLGAYTGNGGASQSIGGVGFSPDYVIVMSASTEEAVHRSMAMPMTFFFDGDIGGTNRITSLDADGFTVGNSSRVNTAATVYHYVSWNAVAGQTGVGSYTGNGADNRSIPGIGFQPEYVIIRPEGDALQKDAVHNSASTGAGTDRTMDFRASGNDANEIQALEADGFQVGSDVQTNYNGRAFYWIAFAGLPTPPPLDGDIISGDSTAVSFTFELIQA